MPGSGVYIKRATYNQLQFIDKGSKLVRKLVREIFPDVHLLASSSCMGKGESSAGLDRHKVEVIKGGSHIFLTLSSLEGFPILLGCAAYSVLMLLLSGLTEKKKVSVAN